MLKYPIYIRSVTNLSDARYCAGMGVEMIGFCFDPQSADYIEPTIAQGIIGWLSGVKIVAEFGENNEAEMQLLIEELKPNMISVSAKSHFSDEILPIIYRIDLANELKVYPPAGSFVLIENSAENLNNYYTNFLKKEISGPYKLIFGTGFVKETIDEVQNVYQPYGYSLKGGKEIMPGLKNFDELADILEAIEI
ncbi:MAG: hypothetical protein ACKVOU_10515 [Cytophagales bacterium]